VKKSLMTVALLAIISVIPVSIQAQTYGVCGNVGAPEGQLDQWAGGISLCVDNQIVGNQYLRTVLSSYNVIGVADAYTSVSPVAVLNYDLGNKWGMSVIGGPDFSVGGEGEINIRSGLEVTRSMFKTDFVKGKAGFEQIFRDDRDGPDLFNLYVGLSVTPPKG